jgi:tripartite-type tricarboxylate transporter receptor subunit TctC
MGTRKDLFAARALCAALLAMAAQAVHSQAPYPARPISMYVGFAAGSATDIVARTLGQKLAERLGQPVVIQNVTGAASTLATDAVSRSAPDGYTLMTVSGALTIGPAVYSNLKFDVEKDLTPIGLVGSLPTVLLVTDSLPARTFGEFVDHARKRPGQLNYGSSGNGGSTHMAAELLSQAVGITMTHVPYRGNAPAGTALMAGEVQVLIDTVLLASQSVKSNRVRALAVTGPVRSPVLPGVPTFAEAGLPSFDASIFFGVMGPAKMPREIVDRLNRELNEVLKDPEVRSRLGTQGGLELTGGTPEQMGQLVRDELAKWRRVSQQAGIRVE